MPIYEYRCGRCGEDFEKMVKLDAPTPPCPSCATAEAVSKRVSASSFVLKGGGWYKDHYGLKSTSSSGSSGGSAGGASND